MTAGPARSEFRSDLPNDAAEAERQRRMTQKLSDDVQTWSSGRRHRGQGVSGPNRVTVVVRKRSRRPEPA